MGSSVPHIRTYQVSLLKPEPSATLRYVSESVMREVVGDRTVDEVITIGRYEIESEAMRHGRKVAIMRNQDQGNSVNPEFAQTSRTCPRFCTQPVELAPGVLTFAELEVLHVLKQIRDGDTSVLVIGSHTSAWVDKGIIPGTVNIPWDTRDIGYSNPVAVKAILETQLGARQRASLWDFDEARTSVLFCNDSWCGQSPATIKGLPRIGYPAHKILRYRGGKQDRESLELTMLKPSGE